MIFKILNCKLLQYPIRFLQLINYKKPKKQRQRQNKTKNNNN